MFSDVMWLAGLLRQTLSHVRVVAALCERSALWKIVKSVILRARLLCERIDVTDKSREGRTVFVCLLS